MPFDPDHFRKRYPGWPLPDLRFRAERERWAGERRLAAAFGLDPAEAGDLGATVWDAFDRAEPLGATAGPAFDPSATLAAAGVPRAGPAAVVEWFSGDQAEVTWTDLARFFEAFWHDGDDDLAVSDASASWVLFVTRFGDVRLARAGAPRDEG